MTRALRDDVTRMLALLRERSEAMFTTMGTNDFRALRVAAELIGELRGELTCLYRALGDAGPGTVAEDERAFLARLVTARMAAGCECDADPFETHDAECPRAGAGQKVASHGGHIHLACDVCGSAHYPPRCERPVAPEPAAPSEPAGPTDIGCGLWARQAGPYTDLGVSRTLLNTLTLDRAAIAALARFAGIPLLDGAWRALHDVAVARANERADAAEARAARAERALAIAKQQAGNRLHDRQIVERQLRKLVERVEMLAEHYVDLDDAPDGAVTAWDLVAMALQEAKALAAAPEAPAGRALDEAPVCNCAHLGKSPSAHVPSCPARALDERAEAKP